MIKSSHAQAAREVTYAKMALETAHKRIDESGVRELIHQALRETIEIQSHAPSK
jgi:hypothetical protein